MEQADEAIPKRVPITDPQSRVTPNKEGGFAPNYTPLAMVGVGDHIGRNDQAAVHIDRRQRRVVRSKTALFVGRYTRLRVRDRNPFGNRFVRLLHP